MNFYYCKSWFWAKKKPTKLLIEEQAKKAHEERKQYTVLVKDIEKPYAVIDIVGDFIGVGFLDNFLREKLSYHFKEVEPGKVFLSMATYREFEGDGDRVLSGTSYIFNQDGKVIIRKQSIDSGGLKESESSTDIESNYDSYPIFGEYDNLLKIERK